MFKYKITDYYNVNDYSSNYIEEYLRSIGIKKVSSFLQQPAAEDELSPWLLDNMKSAIDMLKKHIDNNSKIFLIVDCDPDGYTSGAIFMDYVHVLNPNINIVYALHEGKEHGFEDKIIIPEDADLIVVPDAGSSQELEINNLIEKGKDILILDHHESEVVFNNEHVCVVNNQLSNNFENKSLSGAGIVFKFVQAYDETYLNNDLWQKYYDLATLGGISDVMYSGTLDNNYIFTKGLNNINNKLLKALLEKRAFSVSSSLYPNKIDIAFYITPVLNGVIRIGTKEDKDNLFEAMWNNNIEETEIHTSRGVSTLETFYEKVARESCNIKQKQDKLIEKTLEKVYEKIEYLKLNENKVIIYTTSIENRDEVPQVLTGLVAMKVCAKYNRPTLILRPKLENGIQLYSGSGRGKKAEGFDSLREFLLESGLCEMVAGHAMAHGCSIKEENIDTLTQYCNEKLENIDFGSECIDVCGIDPSIIALNEFAANIGIYGNGIPQPSFIFNGIISNKNWSVMGSKGNTVKIEFNGLSFIMFFAKDLINDLQQYSDKFIDIQIVGRAQFNQFRGCTSLQIVIDNYNITPHSII